MIGWIYSAVARFCALFSRRKLDSELKEEFETHVALLTDDNVRCGMDPQAARRVALIRIGSLDAVREQQRAARGISWLEGGARDLRLAVRHALSSPWLSLIAAVSLAVGIGANITAFNIAKAILWQPLPATAPDRLLSIYTRAQNGAGGYGELSYPEYEYFRDHNGVLDGFALYVRIYFFAQADSDSQRIAGEIVSSNFFSVLGVRTILGRAFEPVDDRVAAPNPEAVISYGLWHSQFGGRPDVVGKSLRLGSAYGFGAARGERAYTVIGVADPEFRGVLMDWVEPPQFWVPINAYPAAALNPISFRAWNWHAAPTVGRMKHGVTLNQATAELKALDHRMTQDHPERARAFGGQYDFSIDVLPLENARFWPAYREEIVTYVVLVLVVVMIVLGIACLNLANLMIARSTARHRELAVRAALGASRGRLIGQMLIESLMLSGAGGLAGFVVATWTWRILAVTGSAGSHFGRPFRVALPPDLHLDPAVALFTLGLSVITGVLFGVWPAWKASKIDPNDTLKEGGQKGGIAGLRLRSGLISLQIAASLVLLVGASLFEHTVRNADAVGRLVDRSHIGLVSVNLPADLYQPFLERMRSVPGVERACLTAGPTRTEIAFTPAETSQPVTARVAGAAACADYFPMSGIQIVQGDGFAPNASEQSPRILINEKLAKQLAPSGNALGQRVVLKTSWLYPSADPAIGTSFEVIGVVKDANTGYYRDGIQPAVYLSSFQFPPATPTLMVQTKGSPYGVFPLIHERLRQFDPDAPLVNARTLQDDVDSDLSRERLTAAIAEALATIAFSLTLIGLYGVVSHSVMSRTGEIGIRIAIGARTADVLRMLTAQNMVMVVAGLAAGVVISLAATRTIASMLYGIEPSDATSFLTAVGLIIVSALAATLLPSWRVSRMSPSRTLRHE